MKDHNYKRKGRKYSVEEVLSKIIEDRVKFDGDYIRMGSQRYKNFKYHGVVCEDCGIEGQYFVKEKMHHDAEFYHLNLYAVNAEGKEVMMTKDHIIPKSKGGKNSQSNLQTMCFPCNVKKADIIKTKVLLIGSNPSEKSDDESAFHPSTRSRIVIDGWFENIDADLAFINICDQKMPNNRSLSVSEIRDCVPNLIIKMDDYFDHVFVGLGKTAQKALQMANVEFFAAPHPSGQNHQLNDKEFVADFLQRLKEYIIQTRSQYEEDFIANRSIAA